jgi:HEAT repeat protein
MTPFLEGSEANMDLLHSSDPAERRRGLLALGESGDEMAADAIAPLLRGDPDREVRLDAAQSLRKLPGLKTTALLLEKAASDDVLLVRVAALEALEHRKDPRAVAGLINLWRLSRAKYDDVVHIGARKALIDTGRSVVPELMRALRDSCATVREFSLEVLGKVGDRSLKDQIVPLTKDPDDLVRLAAARALDEIENKGPPSN